MTDLKPSQRFRRAHADLLREWSRIDARVTQWHTGQGLPELEKRRADRAEYRAVHAEVINEYQKLVQREHRAAAAPELAIES